MGPMPRVGDTAIGCSQIHDVLYIKLTAGIYHISYKPLVLCMARNPAAAYRCCWREIIAGFQSGGWHFRLLSESRVTRTSNITFAAIRSADSTP